MNAVGCDVSLYQNAISTPQVVDFAKMKANGATFVIIKASQANWADRDMVMNWANAKKAGILRGAYHFLVWDVDPIKQAEYFCQLCQYDPPELGLFCDFEWWSAVPGNAMAILDQASGNPTATRIRNGSSVHCGRRNGEYQLQP